VSLLRFCERLCACARACVRLCLCVRAFVRITSSSTAIIKTAETARHVFQLGPNVVILCLHIHDRFSLGLILRRKKRNKKLQPLLPSAYYGVGKIKQMTSDIEIIQTVKLNKLRQQVMLTRRQRDIEIHIC